MNKYTTVTHKYATERGFSAITSGYRKTEHPMLAQAIADLRGIAHLLVESVDGIQIYRKRTEINLLEDLR